MSPRDQEFCETMTTLQFYTERAADCRRDADQSTLENVRLRNLTAADAWDAMALRVRRAQEQRDVNEAAKLA
jgi:hypothetical protein